MTNVTCCTCATVFSIDEALDGFRRRDGKPFYCPNGHGITYSDNPTKKIAEYEARIKELEEELRESQAEVTRLKCELVKVEPKKGFWG